MSTENQDELKVIKVLKFTRKESEWDNWSEKFVALARARGLAGILLGTEQASNADEDIDRKKNDGGYEMTEAERKEKKRHRQANGNAYINLQLSCEELPYDLVSLAKTMTSLKVKIRSPSCQCFSKINWSMSEPISQFG